VDPGGPIALTENPLNSKKIVSRSLRGADVPRAAAGPLAVHYCARVAGVSVHDYTSDPRVLADSVVRYYERFRPDAVWVSADTWVSAQAMGARVGGVDPGQPWGGLGPPFIQTAADLDRIPKPDPGTQGRYPFMLEALRLIVERLGQEVFVVGCFDQCPFSLASQLLGINEIMLKLHDDRPQVEAVMERCLDYGLAYGRAMGEAGADMLSGGDSPAGLIGPELYREMALPFEKRLISGLQAATGKPVSLHICGDSTPILKDMAGLGADVLEIDHQVDIAEAFRITGPDVAFWGNLDPVGLLARGAPGEVEDASQRLLETVRSSGHRRFVLSSGCTLALETPAENLEAMFRAAGIFPP
jgi:uroporphyrinogen decarboxylase